MHDRPPADAARQRKRRKRRTARVREQNRLAQIRHRARERQKKKLYKVRAGPTVIEAVIARSEDAGFPTERAERDSRNRGKVEADLSDVLEQWALKYLRERKCHA